MMTIKIGVPIQIRMGYKVYADEDATAALTWDDSDLMAFTLEQGVVGLGLSAFAATLAALTFLN